MSETELLNAFFSQASAKAARSNILNALAWLLGLLLVTTIAAFKAKLPTLVWGGIGIAAGITFIVYIFAYVYCLFKDRDALRSEKYSIQKLAIERGLRGDDTYGLRELPAAMPRVVAASVEQKAQANEEDETCA